MKMTKLPVWLLLGAAFFTMTFAPTAGASNSSSACAPIGTACVLVTIDYLNTGTGWKYSAWAEGNGLGNIYTTVYMEAPNTSGSRSCVGFNGCKATIEDTTTYLGQRCVRAQGTAKDTISQSGLTPPAIANTKTIQCSEGGGAGLLPKVMPRLDLPLS